MSCDERWFDEWSVEYEDEPYCGEMNIENISDAIYISGTISDCDGNEVGSYDGSDENCDGLRLSFTYDLGNNDRGILRLSMILQPNSDVKTVFGTYEDNNNGDRGRIKMLPINQEKFHRRSACGFFAKAEKEKHRNLTNP